MDLSKGMDMNNENHGDWRPKLNSDLVMQIVEKEAILLDKGNERVHQLNEVGTAILQLCNGIRTVGEIVVTVVERYDVSEDTARTDARELLDRMRHLAILV